MTTVFRNNQNGYGEQNLEFLLNQHSGPVWDPVNHVMANKQKQFKLGPKQRETNVRG